MLSISVFTFNPEQKEEVIKRRIDEELKIPHGMKIIGEWCAMNEGRVFRLIEAESLKETLAAFRFWSDLGKIKITPVVESEKLLHLNVAKKVIR
jgi:hypothetical protein